MKWLCEVALVFPNDGWSVAFFTHRTLSHIKTGALGEFRGIIAAINYKNSYSTTYTDYNNDTYDINVNFSKGGHRVLFVANGHEHYDSLDTDTGNGINYFMTMCDALYKDDNTVAERVGINTQAFDVITINKKTKTVNLTRIGNGTDRSFKY